jgi:hypothetical protein
MKLGLYQKDRAVLVLVGIGMKQCAVMSLALGC